MFHGMTLYVISLNANTVFILHNHIILLVDHRLMKMMLALMKVTWIRILLMVYQTEVVDRVHHITVMISEGEEESKLKNRWTFHAYNIAEIPFHIHG